MFREAANVSIDSIAVTKTDQRRSAFLSSESLQHVAFGQQRENVRTQRTAEVEILTNSADVNLVQLATSLSRTVRAFQRDFPFLPKAHPAAVLIVFRDREQYEQFVPRLGQQFNSVAPIPSSDGYTLQGVSLSYGSPSLGTHRPVYTHELIHGVIARALRLRNAGGWFQEGTASLYQMRRHKQMRFANIVAKGIQRQKYHLPLKELCTGSQIPMDRYWQAATVVEMLMRKQEYRQRLPELLAAFGACGSSKLEPHLKPILETNWQKLTDDWKAFCQQQYLRDK